MAQDTAAATAIVASGTTWSQLKAGGLRAVLDRLATTNAAKANPSVQATASATGGGSSDGSLAAGKYYITYSFVDPFGETLAGGRSAELTVGAGNIPRVTLPSNPTGVQSKNLYLTPAGGAAGTEVLYATGITGTTHDCAEAAVAEAAPPPAANTTGAAACRALFYSIVDDNGSTFQKAYSETVSNYLRGDPIDRRAALMSLVRLEGVARAWTTAMAEIRTLVVANQGTLGNVSYGTMGKRVRTFS